MATVWRATDTRLQRSVAVKLPSEALTLDDRYRRRFEREAQTAAGFSHPNLVAVYDFGTDQQRPYLVMEYVQGATLAERRDTGDDPGAERLAGAILGALAHIHAAGVIHRDVKAENVLIDGEGRILLTDFGIAQGVDATELTGTGQVVGTLRYIAPELMRGERATPRSDLFSCGVLLRDSLQPDSPPRLRRLAERLTTVEPEGRPTSAEGALRLIETGPADAAATAQVPLEQTTQQADFDPGTAEQTTAETASGTRPTAADRVLPYSARRPAPAPVREPSRSAPSSSRGPSSRVLAIAGLLAAVLAIGALILLAEGGGDDDPGTPVAGDGRGAAEEATEDDPPEPPPETTPEPPPETTPEETTAPEEGIPTSDAPDPVQAAALNDEGFALLQAGQPEQALAPLEQSVALYPADSTELNYAFALFNYAQALRLTGDPAAAIPLLQKRLSFSSNQRPVVEEELAIAMEEAGVGDDD